MPITIVPEGATPLLPGVGQLPGAVDPLAPLPDDDDDPTTSETLGAAFRLENTIGSSIAAVDDGVRADEVIDPNFEFVDAIPERYEDQASLYAYVNNQRQADAVTRQIDRELEDRRIIQEAGIFGVVSMFAAAMIDPVNLIPVGGVGYRTYRLGGSILQGATTTAKAGFLSSTAAEVILQHTQTQRTFGEGALNITAGTVLSGILGGGIGTFRSMSAAGRVGRAAEHAQEVAAGVDPGRRVSPSDEAPSAPTVVEDFEASATVKALDDDMTVPAPEEPDVIIPGSLKMTADELAADTEFGAVGAAAVNNADEKLKSALGVEKVVRFQDPLLRTSTSPSIETRRVGQRLAEQPLTYDKNALGIKTPLSVETRIAAHNVGLYKAASFLDEQFIKYRLGREKKFGDIPRVAVGDVLSKPAELTSLDFKREVGRALSQGDQHEIPQVAAVAQKYRAEVFDPLKDDAIELGLLPEDVEVETAPSYLMRVYNSEKIVAERPEFKRRVLRWLGQQRDIQAERAPVLQAELDAVTAELTALLREAGAVKRGQAKAERLLSEKRIALERDVLAGNRNVRQAERDLNREAKRLLEAKPSERLSSDDPLKEFIREARKQVRGPETLSEWIRRSGGVVDSGGELANRDLSKTPRGKRKFIVTEGRSLETLAEQAHEEGFFPLHERPPDQHELLDAIDDDLSGAIVIREDDLNRLAMVEELDGFHKLLDDLGVDLSKSDDEIAFALRNIVEGEDGFVQEVAGFVPSTPGRRAKVSAVQRRVRELEKRLANDEVTAIALRERLGMAIDALADEKGFRPMMRDALDQLKRGAAETRKRKKVLRTEQRKAEFKGGFEDVELDDIADQIIDRIIGTPDGRLPYDINPNVSKGDAGRGGLSGPLKRRSFLIPDREIIDFLETDIEHIARVYTRSMAPDIELVREFGDVNMTQVIDDIRRDYALKAEAVETARGRTKLNRQRDSDIRDIAGMRDRLTGNFGLPADPNSIGFRIGRGVVSLNYLRLLGGMTASAFPDTMRSVMIHGLSRTIGDGLIPLIRDFKAMRLAAEEVKLSGTALDMILDTRAMLIADVMDDFGRHSKLERGIKAAQDRFGFVSLMAPWNAFFKQFVGTVTMTRMFQGMEGVAKGAPVAKEVEKLAQLGIDAADAVNIWRFFEAHGEVRNGVYLPNTEAWTGPGAGEAIRNFRGALKKQTDIIIVTPGQDKPLFASSAFGRVILQFKSFAIASVQRTMLTGLQQRDLAALNGALLSVMAGAMVYAFKQSDAGREISDDPSVWISEGLDRSGLFGWFFDVNNIVEKATRGRIGVNALVGGPPMSRYVSRNTVGALLGPSFGAATDLIGVTAGAIGEGDWTESDSRALRRLLPYQNLIMFRRVLDQAEAGINDALGVRSSR